MDFYLTFWRLGTLSIGIGLLLIGADYFAAPDWDYGISILMAGAAYWTMPLFDRWLRSRNLILIAGAALLMCICVDTVYVGYLTFSRKTLELRDVNFLASTSLYLMCWVVWCLLPEAWEDIKIRRAIAGLKRSTPNLPDPEQW